MEETQSAMPSVGNAKSLLKNKWVWAAVGGVAILAWYFNRGKTFSTPNVEEPQIKAPAGGAYGGLGGSSSSAGIKTQDQLDNFGKLNDTNAQLKELSNQYLAGLGLGDAMESERARLQQIEVQKTLLKQNAAAGKSTVNETSNLTQLLQMADPSADIGVGGRDYNTSTKAEQQDMINKINMQKNNAAYRASEIERAQNVIETRKQAGIDTSQQAKYLASLQQYEQDAFNAAMNEGADDGAE